MSVIRIVPSDSTCECHFGSWRDAFVCLMHLKAGYGKFFRERRPS